MPNYQEVLHIFKDYLDSDPELDVVITRHACAVMLWDPVCQRYTSTVTCRSGKELFDQLLASYERLASFRPENLAGNSRQKSVEFQTAYRALCRKDRAESCR